MVIFERTLVVSTLPFIFYSVVPRRRKPIDFTWWSIIFLFIEDGTIELRFIGLIAVSSASVSQNSSCSCRKGRKRIMLDFHYSSLSCFFFSRSFFFTTFTDIYIVISVDVWNKNPHFQIPYFSNIPKTSHTSYCASSAVYKFSQEVVHQLIAGEQVLFYHFANLTS